jgi:hypothetical protein
MTAEDHLRQILIDNINTFTTGETQRNLSEKVTLEEERKNGYHGRELLELLQNVDDAYQELCESDPSKKGEKVTALIEYKNDILTVSNTGTVFRKDTIERLCQGGVSSKSGKYIGSKGTGFRAILNWAKEIYIYSGGYAVKFSEKFAKQQFDQIKDLKIVKQQIDEGKKLYFPMLYAPEQAEPCATDYHTVIKIVTNLENIKNDDYNVIKQIDALDYLILIFLPNITDIKITTDDKEIHYSKEISKENGLNVVELKNKKDGKLISDPEFFYVFDNSDNPVKIKVNNENEPKEIRLAAAIPKEIRKKEYSIYSFFPIRDAISPFPALLHGTFILDQHRDSIATDQDQINKQVLRELLKFYVNTIADNFGKQEFGDYAVHLLTPLGFKNDNNWRFASEFKKFMLEEFYLDLLAKVKFLPTVNGDYISIQYKPKLIKNKFPSVFKGVDFYTLIQFLDNKEIADLVIKLCEQAKINTFYAEDELCALINKNTWNWSIEQQVEVFVWWEDERYTNFLPNLLKDSKGEWIIRQQTCFLKGQVSVLPDWAEETITIIDNNYQEALINYYEKNKREEFENNKKDKQDTVSRVLTRIVKIINFLEQYTDNLISPVNRLVEDDYKKSVDFVNWLWTNYRGREFKDTALEIRYRFPDKNKKVKFTDSLYFGVDYDNELGEKLLRHTDMSCFEAPAVFGIADDDIDEFKKFINRLGVAILPKIEKTHTPSDKFQNKVRKLCEEIYYFEKFNVDNIKNIEEIIKNVDMETIFCWIKEDEKLYDAVDSGKESADSSVEYHKNRRWDGNNDFLYGRKIPSYLSFLFSNSKCLKISGNTYAPNECILSEEKKLIKIFPCVTNEILKKISIDSKINDTNELKKILKRLGTKEKIIEYESGEFYSYLLKLSNTDIDRNGEISKRIYRQCIEAGSEFGESPGKNRFFNEGKVYAKNKDKQGFYPVNQVYFSSSSVLNISNKLLIETPHRSGSAKKIKEIFNVDEFKENYEIINENFIPYSNNNKFQSEIKDFLRYVFCYRENADENTIKLFQNIKIVLVSNITVLVDGEKFSVLEDYSIIKRSRSYWYIFIPEKITELDVIKTSVAIEEIFKIILNYPTKADTDKIGELYRADEKTRKSLIIKDFGSLEILAEADEKLGNMDLLRNNFKKIVQGSPDYDKEAEQIIDNMDFYDFYSIKNQGYLIDLLKKIKWDISDLQNRGFEQKADITGFFKKIFNDFIENNKKKYKIILFNKLKNTDMTDKSKFLREANKLEIFEYEKLTKNSVLFNPIEIIYKHFPELKEDIENTDLDVIFQKNLKLFAENKNINIVNDMLNDEKNKSLIYFNELEFLNKEYNKMNDSGLTDSAIINGKDSNLFPQTPIVTDFLVPAEQISSEGNKVKIGKIVSTEKENARNKQKQEQGDKAEKFVVTELRGRKIAQVCNFVNSADYSVKWVSSAAQRIEYMAGNDYLHYDIHIEVDNKIALYIEVKSSSDNKCKFEISGDEYNFAKNHADNYMVIFVADRESANPRITPLEMKFWEDEKFSVHPNNFTVTYIYNEKK